MCIMSRFTVSFNLKHLRDASVLPGGSADKESTSNEGDLGSIPRSGRSPGEGNGYPFQYSSWKNPLDRGSWWVYVTKLCPGSGQALTLRSADHKPSAKDSSGGHRADLRLLLLSFFINDLDE